MTDEEINRAIANFFTAECTLPPIPEVVDESMPDTVGCWTLRSRPSWHWSPPDFTHSPLHALMLMRKILEKRGSVTIAKTDAYRICRTVAIEFMEVFEIVPNTG